jgi:hypothetical protein
MAQVTLTIPDAQVPRILAALVTEANPTPTAADYKQLLIDYTKKFVRQHERKVAATTSLDVT